MKSAFITGTSSGLGLGLAEYLSQQGWTVYGCSRRGCNLPGVDDQICDLTDYDSIPGALSSLLEGVESLELVILNAGVLGRIRNLTASSLADLKQVIEINVWANKVVMDWLHAWKKPIAQIVMISSGAAVLGNKGWGGYAISKAALNMLAKLYAHEFAQTHIISVAPGIIDTAMMDYLCGEADAKMFPALERLRQARGTEVMPGPLEAAARLVSILPQLKDWPSGSFVDIREILDPNEYVRLYGRTTNRK